MRAPRPSCPATGAPVAPMFAPSALPNPRAPTHGVCAAARPRSPTTQITCPVRRPPPSAPLAPRAPSASSTSSAAPRLRERLRVIEFTIHQFYNPPVYLVLRHLYRSNVHIRSMRITCAAAQFADVGGTMVTADEHRVRSPQNHLQRSGYYKCPSAHERTFSAEKKSYPFACKLSSRSCGSTSSCRVASPVIVPIV